MDWDAKLEAAVAALTPRQVNEALSATSIRRRFRSSRAATSRKPAHTSNNCFTVGLNARSSESAHQPASAIRRKSGQKKRNLLPRLRRSWNRRQGQLYIAFLTGASVGLLIAAVRRTALVPLAVHAFTEPDLAGLWLWLFA